MLSASKLSGFPIQSHTKTIWQWICLGGLAIALSVTFAADNAASHKVGLAKENISPSEPVRLSGYAARSTEATEIEQSLWVKALAVESVPEGADPEFSLLMTIDNCAVPKPVRDEISRRLRAKFNLQDDHFALSFSHTHSAPCLTGAIPYLFVRDLPEEETERIDRYTQFLIERAVKCGEQALNNLAPASLSWARGEVSFAKNRRTENGPVDHSLPVLKITSPEGALRGLLANYACHCTTLGGDFNSVCGDWASYAQEFIEASHPSVMAMVTIGCGADSNPHPRGSLDLAKQHGREISDQVAELLKQEWRPLRGSLQASAETVELPFAGHFSPEELKARSQQTGIVGFHAKKLLQRLDAGEEFPSTLPYWIQTWSFGDGLTLIFLPGEVVVDYAISLRERLDPDRLWITAYANDAPCYIPSKRILREGGYEAEHSLWYYGQPAQLAPEVEEIILKKVVELTPPSYHRSKPKHGSLNTP